MEEHIQRERTGAGKKKKININQAERLKDLIQRKSKENKEGGGEKK